MTDSMQDPRNTDRLGPEDVEPDLHAAETRPGSPESLLDPGSDARPGTSEELPPVQGLHVPVIGEDGRTAPGRYRTPDVGAEDVEAATGDAPVVVPQDEVEHRQG